MLPDKNTIPDKFPTEQEPSLSGSDLSVVFSLRCRYCKRSIEDKYRRSKCCINCREKHQWIKRKAYAETKFLISIGEIIKSETCEICGKFPTQCHHLNYRRPKLVQWLCPYHHTQAHE